MLGSRSRAVVCLVSVCALASAGLEAGTVRLYKAGEVPNPRVVARILGHAPGAARPATRGLSVRAQPVQEAEQDSQLQLEPNVSDAGQNVLEIERQSEQHNIESTEAASHTLPPDMQEQLRQSLALDQPDQAEATPAHPQALERPQAQAEPSAPPPAAQATDEAAPEDQQPTSLALLVNFGNNSARVSPEQLPALDAVAQGMKLAGLSSRVVIEGHANATGKPEHNLKLSQRRAEAVKRYLITKHAIPARLLVTVGLGEKEPLNAQDPAAPENRRVQFTPMQG